MGLKDKVLNGDSTLTAFNGGTPSQVPGASKQSKLHFEYSINNDPNSIGNPAPSVLDLNGKKPNVPGKLPYIDNLPK
tara:strand:- start:2203 stop:2433 length:231 start_codon:yes stop_codon:yes gene_type:complete